MKVGSNIKKIRELRNYTQEYMAKSLDLSLSGYGKIERNESDVSIKRLEELSEILGVDINTILNFDERHIFNLNHNANGIVQKQHLNNNDGWRELVNYLKEENMRLRQKLDGV